MVEVALRSGERSKAHAAVDRAFDVAYQMDADRVTEHTHIDSLLGSRITTILNGAGIRQVGDLLGHTPQSLQMLAQIRWRSVSIIEGVLEKHGFSLSQNSC